ncbi:hypothetical protein C8R46DRAFT_951640 [Mycena filopes]|nr:hypothetical protein C8R46DRAFT_951640 [Mycena filopes]
MTDTEKGYLPSDADEAAGAKIWSVYISEAEKYDKALVESWKSDMEGMLIFAGLFSAILTAFLIESYKTLAPNSADTTVVLLSQISLQIAGSSNGTTVEIPTSVPFVVPLSSLVCNALWFVSLGLSLSCALIATLVEQWAREFQHKSELRPAPIIRARIFSYLYYGLKRFHMHIVVDVIPLLLHASLIIFFAGLVAFLAPVNYGMMILSAAMLALVLLVYAVLTVLPLVFFDCPYRTPLSGGLWRGIQTIKRFVPSQSDEAPATLNSSNASMADVMGRLAVHRSENRDKRDHRALCWTVRSLSDDAELEPFVEGISDVLWSSQGRRSGYDEHLKVLLHDPGVRLLHRLENFLRGCDSDLLSAETQFRRRVAALKAMWAIATLPGRDGLFLEPLEPFDATLLEHAILPFKTAYYQVSTRTVVNLNLLLSVSGDIHDATQAAVELDGLAKDGIYPSLAPISALLPRITSKLDRLPRHLWQSSADRENYESLVDLGDNPPSTSPSERSQWIALCITTLDSLPTVLLALEYEMFVAYMSDTAAMESWPYEFEATRATFSFDESSVSPEMAGTFSTAFDSIVSQQSRHRRYSQHADEILAILLGICASAFRDDETYFPLNLASYLVTHEAAVSKVAERCNNLWLCSCLTTELVAREHDPSLLSGLVVRALWEIAFLMARQYLESFSYHSTPAVHARALEAIRNAAPSDASSSAIALVQTNILNAMSPTPHEFDNMEAINHVPVYPILLDHPSQSRRARGAETAPAPPITDDSLSILNMRISILIDFIHRCTAPELPYKAARTVSILSDFLPTHPGVDPADQRRFAGAWSAVFTAPDIPDALLEALVDGRLLSGYMYVGSERGRWLDDPRAREMFADSLRAYGRRTEKFEGVTRKVGVILAALEEQ